MLPELNEKKTELLWPVKSEDRKAKKNLNEIYNKPFIHCKLQTPNLMPSAKQIKKFEKYKVVNKNVLENANIQERQKMGGMILNLFHAWSREGD